MADKLITYQIEITCKINKYNVVIPCGANVGIVDEKGEPLNMIGMPEWVKIMAIWIGKYYQYPKITT